MTGYVTLHFSRVLATGLYSSHSQNLLMLQFNQLHDLIESIKGLKCREVLGKEPAEIDMVGQHHEQVNVNLLENV